MRKRQNGANIGSPKALTVSKSHSVAIYIMYHLSTCGVMILFVVSN